ncbi:NAD(P)H-dependent oxidoreductase subunit E [Desulfobulbus propionicus]
MPSLPSRSGPVDTRRAALDQVMHRHDYRPDALIETLHVAQQLYGFLDREILAYIAEQLDIAPAQIFGVATFYNQFRLHPKGEHTLTVCTGTACHVKGNNHLLAWLRDRYHLSPGETTPDNQLSLFEVRCIGACALAPVFLADNQLIGKKSLDEAKTFLQEWIDHATART